jgi:hypothetical protein
MGFLDENDVAAGEEGEPARAGSLGGAANEAGSIHRAGVGAFVVAHGLCGRAVEGLDLPADRSVPAWLGVESDAFVDDLEVGLAGGGIAHIQAKLEMNFGSSRKGAFSTSVLDQWLAQVATGIVRPERDRLVLAVGHASQPLRNLGTALARRRKHKRDLSYAHSSGELEVLDMLRGLVDLDHRDTELVLDMAVILELHVLHEARESALAGSALLEGTVVEPGQGRAAFNELSRVVRRLGRERARLEMPSWREVLTEAGIKILLGPTPETATERLESARGRYFDRIHRDGAHIDLRPIGFEIAPIPIDDPASDLRVVRSDADDREALSSDQLIHVLRRAGRLLVAGLPGRGKTTALRQLAACAVNHRDWPVPILARLDLVKNSLGTKNVLDAIVDDALADMREQDREILRPWLGERLAAGRALLLLDGLDECREQAGTVVSGVQSLLPQLHNDVEVIIATRASTLSMAQTLGFSSYQLSMPSHFDDTLRRVAHAMAWELEVPEDDRNEWVDKRLRWERDAVARDAPLQETPLIRLVLLFLTRHQEVSELPKRRADILSRVVDEAAERWEIRAKRLDSLRVGDLHGSVAKRALLRGFETIAHVTQRQGRSSKEDVHHALTETYRAEFGSAAGVARAIADDVITFWDEASIFVLGADVGEMAPRVRLLAEIGEARYGSALEDRDIDTWVRGHLNDASDEAEVLVLGACLDQRIALALLDAATGSGDREQLLITARALQEGAALDDRRVERLTRELRAHLDDEPWTAWDVAKAIARFPLPQKLAAETLDDFRRLLPPSHRDIGVVLGMISWGSDAGEFDPVVERVLDAGHPPRLKPPADSSEHPLAWATVDRGYARAVISSAETILPRRPDLAPKFSEVAANHLASMDQSAIERILDENGHHDLVEARRRREFASAGTMIDSLKIGQAGETRFMELLVALGEKTDTSWRERRRLDELAQLVATLEVAHSPAGWLPVAALKHEEGLATVLDLFCDLGAFDTNLVSTEAAAVQSSDDMDLGFLFVAEPEGREMRWDRLEDPEERRRLLIELIPIHPWLRFLAVKALFDCPAHEECLEELAPLLDHRDPQVRSSAAKLSTVHVHDNAVVLEQLGAADDPHIRSQVGLVEGSVWQESRDAAYLPILSALLVDEDLGVRRHVLKGLGDGAGAEAFMAAMKRSEREQPTGWRCPHCDAINGTSDTSCGNCRIVGPAIQ